jgi:hypothetical protein
MLAGSIWFRHAAAIRAIFQMDRSPGRSVPQASALHVPLNVQRQSLDVNIIAMGRIRQAVAVSPLVKFQQFEVVHVVRQRVSTTWVAVRHAAHVPGRKVPQIVQAESGPPDVPAADLVDLEGPRVGNRVARSTLRLLVPRPFAELVVRAEEILVWSGADAVFRE